MENKEQKVAKLKEELIKVLTELDKIAQVQFLDCDVIKDTVYNFKDVIYDPECNKVFIEIAMWSDNLPAHAGL